MNLYKCRREPNLYLREPNEVRAKTEASTLAGCDGNGRCEYIKECECGERGCADREDLAEVRLLGVEDEDSHERNNKALD